MVENYEKSIIKDALLECDLNLTMTATHLNISHSNRYNKIKRYKINV
ncbi:helix-turn-helix domain-containing protein [Faecalispora jeddahensis]|jgi:transcriptional regulator with PAS, ATPase and Fis domain|nr:hypothetical protein [Oscillospiraceae bacterium]